MPKRKRSLVRIVLKSLLGIISIPILLLLIVLIVLQFPSSQTYLAGKAVAYLSERTGAKMTLRKLSLSLYGAINLEDLLIRDLKSDTLLYSRNLHVNLDFAALLSKRIRLNSVEINTFTSHIYRNALGYNFDFILKAFASDKKGAIQPADSSEKGWQFSLKDIHLEHIDAHYQDQLSGINADLRLGNFKSTIETFDLPGKKIHIRSLQLDSSFIAIVQNIPLQNATTAVTPFDLDITVSKVNLGQVKARYKNAIDKTEMNVDIGQLKLRVNKMDLIKQNFDVAELTLFSSSVAYDNFSKMSASGIDYNHLLVTALNLKAKNIIASFDKIKLDLQNLSFKERSGFLLKKLSAGVDYDQKHVLMNALDLQTANSHLRGELGANYSSVQQLADSLATLSVRADFKESSLAARDLFFFVPTLSDNQYFIKSKSAKLLLDGSLYGTLDHLVLQQVQLRAGTNTSIRVNGEIAHVLHPDELYARLTSFRVSGSKKDLIDLLPAGALPSSIHFPESFQLNGSFTGYLNNFNAIMAIQSSIGNAKLSAKMDPAAGNKKQPYRVEIKTENFDLGELLNQPGNLGPVSLEASLEGQGWDTASIQANLKITVSRALLNGYAYKNLFLSGAIDKQSFTGQLKAEDPNLSFLFAGYLNFDPKHPVATFTLDLKGADLKALHFSKQDTRVCAYITSDLEDGGKNPTGTLAIRNIQLARNGKRYNLDSLILRSTLKDGISDIALHSPIFNADMNGEIKLSQLPGQLMKQLNSYFKLQQTEVIAGSDKQKFKFSLVLLDPTFLKELASSLQKLSTFSVIGSYDSQAREFKVQTELSQLMYSGVKVDSLKLAIQSDQQQLFCHLHVAELSNPNLKFENLAFSGELKDNSLSFKLSTQKDDSTKLMAISAVIKNTNEKKYELKLEKDLVLNSESWDIDPTNYLVFGAAGIYANNVVLSNADHAIAFNSPEKNEQSPLEAKFTNFDLTTLSRLIENNNDLVKGSMNGDVTLEKRNGAFAFRSDLTISDFAFKAVPVGTITLKANNFERVDKYDVELQVEGNKNDIVVNGSYLIADKKDNLALIVNVNHLNLASVEPFTYGQASRMSGSMSGKLNLAGSAGKPNISGELNFKEAAFRPRILDSYLTVHEGKLSFANGKVLVPNLTIYDSLANKAQVSGTVDIQDLSTIRTDLEIKTTNFLALNTTWKDNALYYGRVFLDSDIHLKGTLDAPMLDIKARLNKGSTLTYVKPEDQVSKNENKGIIEFINPLHRDTTIMMRLNDSLKTIKGVKGVELSATLDFDKTVQLKMMVDPESGDSLFVIGGGTLDFGMDRAGRTSLTGKYKINDGGYHLSISEVVKRDFKIEKGSSIIWSGDILDAYVDLKAVYTIKTSPIDLVQDEVAVMTEAEKNKYRNLLTFMVYLKMTGFISLPEISFDIQLAPNDRGALNGAIYSKLGALREQESELNKQVFALLTLGRFIGDNPLDNGNDPGGLSSASRSSASKVLTQQLSTLSNKYVKFVNLDLGVNSFEDYSSGQEQGRTQLQVGVSKQLLNDKITVRVGGNVELEGEKAQQNNASDMAGNISVDYKVTHDGRYKLKAFRENEYENPIEGELIKTGMGILYIRNYNTLKELLSKPLKKADRIEE